MSLLTGFVNVCNCLGAGAGYLIVCGQVFEVLSGLRLAALSHLAPLRVQGEGGCEASAAVLALPPQAATLLRDERAAALENFKLYHIGNPPYHLCMVAEPVYCH